MHKSRRIALLAASLLLATLSSGAQYVVVYSDSGVGTRTDLTALATDILRGDGTYGALAAGTPITGSVLHTAVTAPGTPSAGKASIFVDSTTKTLQAKNDAGTVSTTVIPDTGASNQFLTAVSAGGVISKAQPGFSNLSGSASCAQLPALTGNVTSSAGTCATTLAASLTLTTPNIGVASGTSLAATGAVTSNGTAGIGYATGAGGTVTQATSRTTGVTLSKLSGAITTNTTSLAALAAATFTVTNTTVAIGDVVLVSIRSGATNVKTDVRVTGVAAGSFNITVHNIDATTAEVGAIVVNFLVLKGVTS